MRSPTPNEMDERSLAGEEALLRATLAERAEFGVGCERDWELVAPRLRFEAASGGKEASQVGKTPAIWLRGSLRRGRLRTWPGMIMLAAMCVGLMGVGFATFEWAGPFVGQKLGLIGERHLYTAVNQSRDDAGVTITVDKAYVDSGNVYIAFRFQPDQAIAGSFSLATFNLTDQYGEEGGAGIIQCAARAGDNAPQACVLDSPPFHPPADVTSLTLTFDVMALYRVQSSGESQRIEGSWRFVFTIPFHTRNLGPGGPYAQPTAS